MTFADLTRALAAALDEQVGAVAAWHRAEPDPAAWSDADLGHLVLAEHWANFRLWHVEDEARRTDVGPEVIAACKRAIDGLNQARNDAMERIDERLLVLLGPLLPATSAERHNTETVGAAVDRLSILALKIFHMAEQCQRPDADAGHRVRCAGKLAVLTQQRADLVRSVLDLLEEYHQGLKRPKVYYQFKMYNDPSLNPALYGAKDGAL